MRALRTTSPISSVSRPGSGQVSRVRQSGCRLLLAGCMLALIVPVSHHEAAFAQDRGPVQRVVSGKVISKSDSPLKGAVVYLKDDHTNAVKSFIADDAGGYRFGQLSQNTDYEIWAESNGKKSPVKTISSFDSKNSFMINLKIDTGA